MLTVRDGVPMFAFLRLFLVGFLGLTLVYGAVVLAERYRIRRRLRDDWVRRDRPGRAEVFVRRGMRLYAQSMGRKLLLAVYVVPVVTVLVIIYVVNFM